MKKIPFTLYVLTFLLYVAPALAHELTTRSDTGNFLAELPAPEFATPIKSFCGATAVSFGVSNPTPGAATEIYRSLAKDGQFEHRYTLVPGAQSFHDDDLKPRTPYYYTLRSVMDGDASGFSDTLELTSGSDFFTPVFEADHLEDGRFEFRLQDHSYADASYEIYKSESHNEFVPELFKELILPDSGSTAVFYDNTLIDNSGEFHYIVNAVLACEGNPRLYEIAGDTLYIFPPEELVAPHIELFGPPSYTEYINACANELILLLENRTSEGQIELYRSFSPEGGFELITTSDGWIYYDRNLVPRKLYYYKGRTVRDGEYSEFSDVVSAESGPAFFSPVITTTVLPDQTVEVKIQDRSVLDYWYTYFGRNVTDGGIKTVSGEFQLLDSGRTYTFIDTLVVPGKTYTYHTYVHLNCIGMPNAGEFISDSVTINALPNLPTVYNFALVDPFSDQEIGVLHNNDEFNASTKYNILANVDGKTRSVEFLLNGKKYKDNKAPFALFGEHKGNFHPGKLKAGFYSLTATAYDGKNFKGRKGAPLTIHFKVINGNSAPVLAFDLTKGKIEIHVYPNPVIGHATFQLSGQPKGIVHIKVVDQSGNIFLSSAGKLNDAGLLSKEWDATYLQKGTYYVLIKMNNNTFTHRIFINK